MTLMRAASDAGVRLVAGVAVGGAREGRRRSSRSTMPVRIFRRRPPRRCRWHALGGPRRRRSRLPGSDSRPSRHCGAWARRPLPARTGSGNRRGASVSWRACSRSASERRPCSGAYVPRPRPDPWGRGLRASRGPRMRRVLPDARAVLEAIGGFDRLLLARYGHAHASAHHTGASSSSAMRPTRRRRTSAKARTSRCSTRARSRMRCAARPPRHGVRGDGIGRRRLQNARYVC